MKDFKQDFAQEMKNNISWLKLAGFILSLCGLFLLMSFYLPSALLNLCIAMIYLMISIITLIQAIRFWFRKSLGFILHILSALLYGLMGFFFLMNQWVFLYPFLKLLALSLAVALFIMGIFRISIAIKEHLAFGWLWTFYCGIINICSMALLMCILFRLPFAAIIMSTGADVLFTGFALFALGFYAPFYNITKNVSK